LELKHSEFAFVRKLLFVVAKQKFYRDCELVRVPLHEPSPNFEAGIAPFGDPIARLPRNQRQRHDHATIFAQSRYAIGDPRFPIVYLRPPLQCQRYENVLSPLARIMQPMLADVA
jgi:hypothetical protein